MRDLQSGPAASRARCSGRLASGRILPGGSCGSSGRELGLEPMGKLLTRRVFVVRGAAVAGALALPAGTLARESKTTAVYKLETGCGPGACACHACFNHDFYSLFPSYKAADGNRAHSRCNCAIVKGSLHSGTYVALFGKPGQLFSYRVDSRQPYVQALLKKHPPQF
jgi:hypothetical protein